MMTGNTNGRKPFGTKRTDAVLHRKLLRYMLPAMLTSAAFSLSEFVDSMIVANLLNTEALAIVQLGSPVILLCATAYQLLGIGGATNYAISLGERDEKKAGSFFTAALLTALLLSVLLTLVGFVFFRPLSGMLCADRHLKDGFDAYFSALLFSVPFLVTIMSMVSFLPAAGAPVLCSAVNILANVVNVAMDYVYIRVFGMGVEGAAWATLTGYACSAVVLVWALTSKKVNVRKARPSRKAFRLLPEILKTGGASGLTQLGYAVKYAFCNTLATQYAGVIGIVAFSVCVQSVSVISIFIGAVQDSAMPLLGMLHGQRDYKGESSVLRRSLLLMLAFSALCTLFFCLFPAPFASLYDIHAGSRALPMCVTALTVTSLLFLPRSVCVVFMKYLQVIGHKLYAMAASCLDGFVLIVPVSLALTAAFGIDGLWWAFPVSGVILLVLMLFTNLAISKKHPDTRSGLLLEEKDAEHTPLLDVTILDNDGDISRLSETVQDLCEENGVSHAASVRTALLLEEMAVYMRNRRRQPGYVDVMMRAYPDSIFLNFRSIGGSLNPGEETDNDIHENMQLLRGMAREIDNSYIMGMNNIQIVLDRTE